MLVYQRVTWEKKKHLDLGTYTTSLIWARMTSLTPGMVVVVLFRAVDLA